MVVKRTRKPRKSSVFGDFKFEIGDRVKYIGTLFDNLTGKEGEVVRQSRPKGKTYYDVKFDFDEKARPFMETVLVLVSKAVIEENNDTIKGEENENN